MSRTQRVVLIVGLIVIAANFLFWQHDYGGWFLVFTQSRYNFYDMFLRQVIIFSLFGTILWSLRQYPHQLNRHAKTILWIGESLVLLLGLFSPDGWSIHFYFTSSVYPPNGIIPCLFFIGLVSILTVQTTVIIAQQIHCRYKDAFYTGVILLAASQVIILTPVQEDAASGNAIQFVIVAPVVIILYQALLTKVRNEKRRQQLETACDTADDRQRPAEP